VDQDLSELERRARANPEDRDLADRLDRALLRAGRDEQVQARYRFKFQCPLRFEDLQASGDDLTQRSCARCERSVRLVRTPEELAERVAAGECVAIPQDSLAAGCLELAESPDVSSASQPGRPCVHASALRFVDLDQLEIPRAALELIPPSFALTYRVVPVALWPAQREGAAEPLALNPRTGEVSSLEDPIPCLEVACSPETSATVVEDLEFMLDLEIRVALASPDALGRALERHYPDSGESPFDVLLGDVVVG